MGENKRITTKRKENTKRGKRERDVTEIRR